MNPVKELPGDRRKIEGHGWGMLLIADRHRAALPRVSNTGDKIGNHRHTVPAVVPRELYAPCCLFCPLFAASIEITPRHPVSVRGRYEMRAVCFERSKLLVFVAVDIEDWYRLEKPRGRIHERVATATTPLTS